VRRWAGEVTLLGRKEAEHGKWREGRRGPGWQQGGVEQTHAELKRKASAEGVVRPSDGATRENGGGRAGTQP